MSYARADDEPFVERLHSDLEAAGIKVWWDRDTMKSRGRTFLQEIRDAIESVDRIIAVIGPAATHSEYVRYEWDHAALFAKGLLPILRLGDHDLVPSELLPENDQGLAAGALGKLHCPDFRAKRSYQQAFDELIKLIRQPVPPLASYYGTPALPPHFLPRRDDLLWLKNTVLADIQRPTVITSAKQTAALHGMSGVGKSVLAAAFARAISTRRAMVHGVVWLAAGQDANKLTLLTNMQALGTTFGDAKENYADEVSARQHLSYVLADKVCLIILDDVWSIEQAEPFRNALGPRARLLVTTRDGNLVTALGAEEHPLAVLSDEQALALLAEWSDQNRETMQADARQVASQCGNLPLALALCGAMAGDGTSWRDLSDALTETDLTFIEARLPNYPYTNVLRAIGVSVEMLGREDPVAVKRYHELAMFPRKVVAPEAAVLTLWCREKGISERDARKLLTKLGRKALLTLQGAAPSRQVSFHDLQHDYLRAVAGDGIAALHNDIIEAYRAKCSGRWATLVDDGYVFAHLPSHLAEAGRRNELRALLLDYPWLAAKLQATDVNALIADCNRLHGDEDIDLVQQALQLSAHVLAVDPSQLPSQLTGRLHDSKQSLLTQLLAQIEQHAGCTCLLPLSASLLSPGDSLLRTFSCEGGTSGLVALAPAPDTNHVIWEVRRTSDSSLLQLWNFRTGKFVRTICSVPATHSWSDAFYHASMTISSCGRHIFLAYENGPLSYVSVQDGKYHCLLKSPSLTTDVLQYGHSAVTAHSDGRIIWWNINDNVSRTYTFTGGPERRYTCLGMLNGSPHALSADLKTATVTLINCTNYSCRQLHIRGTHKYQAHDKWLIINNNTLLIIKSHASNLSWSTFDLSTGKQIGDHIGKVDNSSPWNFAVAYLNKENSFLIGLNNGSIALCDIDSGNVTRARAAHARCVTGVEILSTGKDALTVAIDGTIKVWDIPTFLLNDGRKFFSAPISSVLTSSNGRWIIFGLGNGSIHVFDNLRRLNWKRELDWGLELLRGGIRPLAFASNDRIALFSLGRRSLLVVDIELWELVAQCDVSSDISGAAFIDDGHHAIIAFEHWYAPAVYNLFTGKTVGRPPHLPYCTSHCFEIRPNSLRALVGTRERTIALWDIQEQMKPGAFDRKIEMRTIDDNLGDHETTLLTTTRNGKKLLSVNNRLEISVFDIASRTLDNRFSFHQHAVTGIVALANGDRALSCSLDSTIRLWDIRTGNILSTFTAEAGITCMAMIANNVVVAGDLSGAVHHLHIPA